MDENIANIALNNMSKAILVSNYQEKDSNIDDYSLAIYRNILD